MREIEFRGQILYAMNKWVHGYLVASHSCAAWIKDENGHQVEVRVNTVGQYIGREDRNGTKIFEGDKTRRIGDATTKELSGVVRYEDCGFTTQPIDNEYWVESVLCYDSEVIEVIGNIHDK